MNYCRQTTTWIRTGDMCTDSVQAGKPCVNASVQASVQANVQYTAGV